MARVILLVDDEVDLVEVLRDALELSMPSFRVIAATSAEGAREAVRDLPAEALALVCVDQRLGGTSGLELLRALRGRWPRVPAMVFTGQSSPQIEQGARQLEARVITKPLRLADWLREVERSLGQ